MTSPAPWEDESRVLRLGASNLSGRGDVEITAVTVDPIAVPGDAYVLDRRADTQLGWAILVDGRWRGGTGMPPAAASAAVPDPALLADLAAAVLADIGEHAEPGLAPPARAEAVRQTARAIPAPSTDAEVVAFRQPTEDIVMLDERGLVVRRVFGHALSETVGGWGHPDGGFTWAGTGWHPVPDIVAAARLDGWSAAVVAVGRFAMVGLRHGDDPPVWRPLGPDGADDLYRAGVGTVFLGAGTLASIATFTAPENVRGPMIMDAALLARRTSYVVSEPAPGTAPAPMSPKDAWALLRTSARPTTPIAGAALPPALTASLRRRVDSRPVPEALIALGLHIEEDWNLGDRGSVTISYQLEAGRTDGYIVEAIERRRITHATACRNRHLVERTDLCASCRTPTCAACPDDVRPCALCHGSTCGHCITTADGRCPACAEMAKVKLLDRRRFHVPMTSGAAWYGESPFVQVTVRRRKDSWTIERRDHTGGGEEPLAGPAYDLFRAQYG